MEGDPEQLVAGWVSGIVTATHGVTLNDELKALISQRLSDGATQPSRHDQDAQALFALLERTGLFAPLLVSPATDRSV